MKKYLLYVLCLMGCVGNKQTVQTDAVTQPVVYTPLNFLVMGDWGRNGADHQKQVAKQMGKTAARQHSAFIITTGDNFYPSGVASEFDPLFKYSFEDIYTDFSLQWDWYPVLGNHDYKTNPDAQVKYSSISRRWKMPARYYAKKFSINFDTTQQVLVAFIDTNPFIKEFYQNAEYGPNVRTQDTVAQKKWLDSLFTNASPSVKWRIVVGHHPPYTGGGRTNAYDTRAMQNSIVPLLKKYKVNIYLAGHEHSLQHILPDNTTHYFISGSASEVTPSRMLAESKFAASEYGFMSFSVSADKAMVQLINDKGRVLYQTSIVK
jgi:tartrate-resistant acid phosphatase type 5